MRGVSVRDTSSPRIDLLLCIRKHERCHRASCRFRGACFSTVLAASYPQISCRMSACSGSLVMINASARNGQIGSNGRCIPLCTRSGVATARSAINGRHSSHIRSIRAIACTTWSQSGSVRGCVRCCAEFRIDLVPGHVSRNRRLAPAPYPILR
jgi:hypothetical protein